MGALLTGAAGAAVVTAGSGSLGDWVKDKLNEIFEYLKFWYIVDQSEEAVILYKGRYHRTLKPGYHLKFPILEIGNSAHVKPDTLEIEPICITTVDGKTIMAGMVLNYEVEDIKKFLYDNNDAPSNLKDLARGELSDLIEDINWSDIRKKTTKNAIFKKIEAYSKSLGIKLLGLKFTTKAETRVFKLFNEQNKDKVPQDAFV